MGHDRELDRYRIPVGEYIRRSEENLEAFERVKAALARGSAMTVERSNEYAASIVNSMVTGEPSVVYGNVPNTGLIPALPEGTCVEVPCLVDHTGVRPTPVPDYPPQLAALNRTYVNVVELTVRAVLEARPEHIRHAAMLDPNAARDADPRRDRRALRRSRPRTRRADPGRPATAGVGRRPPSPREAWHDRDHARPGHEGLSERRPRRRRPLARDRRGRVLRPRRPVRLRQVDAPADDRRARGRHGGRRPDRRRRRHRAPAAAERHRDGLSELRALSRT